MFLEALKISAKLTPLFLTVCLQKTRKSMFKRDQARQDLFSKNEHSELTQTDYNPATS